MGQTRSGRSARLSPKVLAISAHTIFKLEQTTGAALNDALLHQIVDNLGRHPRQRARVLAETAGSGASSVGMVLFFLDRELSSVTQQHDESAALTA
jgi:hypothetical protein